MYNIGKASITLAALRRETMERGKMMKSNALGFGLAGLIFADLAGLPEAMLAFTVPNLVTAIALWIISTKSPLGRGSPKRRFSEIEQRRV